MPNNKRTIFVASAIWENNGKHYKQDYVICAANNEIAKQKIERKLSGIARRPNINIENKADKVDSPIDKTYFTSEAITLVDPTGTNTYLMETISELTIRWGQEIGWRKKMSELSDVDTLCLDKLVNTPNKTELIADWANEYCDRNETDIEAFFIEKLIGYIGSDISTVNDMKPINDGQYARIMREAHEEAKRIIEKAEKEASIKTKQVDEQIKAMIDIIKNLEDITKSGIVIKAEEQIVQPAKQIEETSEPEIEEYDLPDDNGEELEAETADSEYIDFDENTSDETTQQNEPVTQSEFDETPSTEFADNTIEIQTQPDEKPDFSQSELNETDDEQEEESNKTLTNKETNITEDDEVPDITEQVPRTEPKQISQDVIIKAIKERIAPVRLIEQLKRMTCVIEDKNHNPQMVNGYDSYLMYCKQYGKQAEPYRFEIIINILKACNPINGKSAIRYIYDIYLNGDDDDNF